MLFISRSSVHRFGLCFERHSQTSIYRPAAIQISALNTAHAFFSSDRIPKAARSCTTNNLTEPVHPEDTHAKSNTYNIRDAGTSDKYFDFKKIEYTTYAWWHNSGFFQPSANTQLPVFTVPMPPPNVTGYLHMGHALFVSLQDIMARYQRMRGRATLWLPGTDHAGIATQLLVEKHLKAEGLSRQSLGREKFLKRVWQWKQEKGDYIVEQMKRLGASADWSRHKFTLDEDMSASVVEAFVNLHEKGLIYRDTYMVNWSPGLQTSISDLEVDYNEEESLLYTFKYPLLPTSGDKLLPKASHMEFIPISTTRPETILGDAAIMIHPDDERYKHLIGRCAVVPMTNGRTIPVLADTYVDMTFGTGALKITPAHDLQDYELGKKYNLEVLNIFHKDASMNTKEAMNMHSQRPANNEIATSKYEGMDRFQCRAELWKDLQQMGLAVGTTPHVARVPRSQRGGEIIEPLVSRQWFVKMDHMAEQAVTAVHTGQLKIIPNRFEKMWHNWLTNIRPWCISRQLWWGHRIPVYYVENRSEEEYIVARTEREAYEKARQKYPADAAAGTLRLRQEDDVLDTWFSSALWPFATLGWPHDVRHPTAPHNSSMSAASADLTSDFHRFYPTSVLETGYDILFFWVARMVMLGMELTQRIPFHTVYLHGLVRDEHGAKMSKTKGNVIDPLQAVEQYGTDALRFTLVTGSTPGFDIPLSKQRLENSRNFVNKLWNTGKYITHVLGTEKPVGRTEWSEDRDQRPLSISDTRAWPLSERYIVSRIHEVSIAVTNALESHEYSDAGKLIHDFLWDEFADWYLEISKTRVKPASFESDAAKHAELSKWVLVYVWDKGLKLLHPYMPFITESLWQRLPHQGPSIMKSDWPVSVAVVPIAPIPDARLAPPGAEAPLRAPVSETSGTIDHSVNWFIDKSAISSFKTLQAVVRTIRNARTNYDVLPSHKITAIILVHSQELVDVLRSEHSCLASLAKVDPNNLTIMLYADYGTQRPQDQSMAHLIVEQETNQLPNSQCTAAAASPPIEVFIPVDSMKAASTEKLLSSLDASKEVQRLQKQADKITREITALESRLTPAHMAKAPAAVTSQWTASLFEKREQLQAIQKNMEKYKKKL